MYFLLQVNLLISWFIFVLTVLYLLTILSFSLIKVEVFREMQQVINSMKLSIGIEDTAGIFMLSPSFNYAHSTLTNTSRYLEEVSAHVSSFRYYISKFTFMEIG